MPSRARSATSPASDEQIAHVQGELRALHASERWRAVEEVGAAQARATDQDERARRAEARVAELRDEEAVLARELSAAGEELTGAERALDAAGAALREAACGRRARRPAAAPAARARRRAAGLRPPHPAQPRCASWPNCTPPALRRGPRRTGSVSALDVAEAAERDLRARRDELELERDEAQERLSEAVDAWAAGLTELRPEPGEELDEAVLRATRRLAAEEEQCSARRRELAVSRAALEAEQSDLHADLDAPPPLAPWRDADQPGAPLWRLCDFAPGLSDRERAGLERALEASGLLDARVDEGGALRFGHLVIEGVQHATSTALKQDAAPPGEAPAARPRRAASAGRRRAAGARRAPRTLADVLSAPAALRPALRAVAVLDADARGPLAVALDGTFALGPLRGKGADAPARFIGADARQAARERGSTPSTESSRG